MIDDSTLSKTRLSDRIFFALQLANDQKDIQTATILVSALDMAMTRNAGGGEFVERRDYPESFIQELDRFQKLKDGLAA